jgi:hypothetical protein
LKRASTTRASVAASRNSAPSPGKSTHYSRLDPQPIEIIEAWNLGFHLGGVLKYIARAPAKGTELRDLRKAVWFLQRRIEVREAEMAGKRPPRPKPQA